MSDFRLWSDFRLSTLDRSRKRAAHPRIWVGRSWFFIGFWWILGQFWAVSAVRASAQDLGGFWASAQGLYIAVSAAFPVWVGTYTTNDKSGLQSRKTAATGGHKNSPGGVPRSDRKRKAANGQTVNGFYIYFVFFRISDKITSGKTNTHKTIIFPSSYQQLNNSSK